MKQKPLLSPSRNSTYEEESANGLKMDLRRKTCDIRTRRSIYFLEVFSLLSQPLPRLCINLFVISEMFATPAVNRFTRQTLPTV
jgi:hypothetical protein